jgi:hypothetical protein
MNQYFEVGEEVILQPVNPKAQSLAGETAVVEMVIKQGGVYDCPHCGKNCIVTTTDVGYYVSVEAPTRCCDGFSQASLRKKYPPSDESFSELMQSLNKEGVEV